MMRLSKSSPPRKVSPFVDITSNWCSLSTSAISIIEMSNVPPPRSYTAILRSPSFLFMQDAPGKPGPSHLLAARLHPGVAVLRLDDLVRDHLDIALHHLVLEFAADQ